MRQFFIALMLIFSVIPSIDAKEQHGAHEHGKGKLDIAIDGQTVNMEFESPSASIYGFEHEPKTAAQTQARDKAVAAVQSEVGKMFAFDGKHGCQVEVKKIDPFAHEEHHGDHGEFRAQFSAKCQSNPTGSLLKIDFWTTFPKLKSVDVQIVGDKSQGGGTVSKSKNSVKL